MEDVLTQLTRQFLPQMSPAERSKALRSLRAVIDAELFDLAAKADGEVEDPDRICPKCGSPHFVKRGRDSRGRQRFLCCGCAGSFTDATMRIFSTTKLAQGAMVSTDRARVYRRVLPSLGVGEHVAAKRDEHAINRVNGLHSQLRHFIGRFRGVSTRRLGNYLAWFKWTWCFKVRRSADELAELIMRQAARGTYETTWRQYKVTPHPFYDYWVKQAKWDSRARMAIYGVA